MLSVAAAAPASADMLVLNANGFGFSNSASSWTQVTGANLGTTPVYVDLDNGGVVRDYQISDQTDGWAFLYSGYTYFYVFWSYAGIDYQNSTFSVPTYVTLHQMTYSVPSYNRTVVLNLDGSGVGTMTNQSVLYARYLVDGKLTTGQRGFISEAGLPQSVIDTGALEITAPDLEDKIVENTEAIEDLKDSILSTEGSETVISGVLGDDEEGWLCSRLGFLCTVVNIPVTMLETVFVTPASDSWDFPGITLPGFDLEIPAQEVSLWTFIPSATQMLIKGGATFIIILLWIKGMFSLYRRFTGEEQTVQVEGAD